MERKEKPKQPVKKNNTGKSKELKTEPPISEKDEVKQAEERTKNTPHKL
jgi:hypothetical protein